jgi:hypothetical protein
VLSTRCYSSRAGTVHMALFIPPSVLYPMRSPCRMTPRLLPSMIGSRPSSWRPRTLRHRPPLRVAASRPPASSRRRSPRPSPWSRRLQLAVSACHLHLHLCILWSQPRSLSPPPLRPTKTGLLPDFTFRQLQCSTSASC